MKAVKIPLEKLDKYLDHMQKAYEGNKNILNQEVGKYIRNSI